MGAVNKAIIVGNLGSDPEVRHTTGGQSVANFTVATNESWTDKAGAKQERTEWHRIVVWGKLAELCGEHLSKGRQVYLEGSIQTRKWEDKSGVEKYTTEIVARVVTFLGSKSDGGGQRSGGRDDFGPPPPGFGDDKRQRGVGGPPGPSDEDIPF